MNTNLDAINWALKVRGLDPVSWKMLVKLASRVNSERGDFDVWPSNRQIAEDVEISVASVKRRLSVLVDAGFIKILPRTREDGSTTSNLVRVMVHAKHMMPGNETIEIHADSMDPNQAWNRGVQIEGGVQIDPGGGSELCTGAQVTAEPCTERLNRTSEGEKESPPPTDVGGTPSEESDLFALVGDHALGEPYLPLWEQVEQSWNAMTAVHTRIASISAMNPSRRNKVEARANQFVADRKRHGEHITPAQAWQRIFDAIPRSTFLRGMAPPGKGRTKPFKLDLDYVLRPDQFLKIIEGSYDDDPRYREQAGFDASTGRTYSPAEEATRDAIAGLRSSDPRRAEGRDPRGYGRSDDRMSARGLGRLPR